MRVLLLVGLLFVFQIFSMLSCALPPVRPITLAEITKLKINAVFDCENSFKEVLDYLNRDGVVVFECMSKRRPVEPYYIKLMATSTGPEVIAFPTSEYVD